MVRVDMALADQEIVHHSCSYCDIRFWEANGERVSLPEILELAAPQAPERP